MRQVESESSGIHASYEALQAVQQYLLSEECRNAFNQVPPMAAGSPEHVKYHSTEEMQKRKDKATAKKNKVGGILSWFLFSSSLLFSFFFFFTLFFTLFFSHRVHVYCDESPSLTFEL